MQEKINANRLNENLFNQYLPLVYKLVERVNYGYIEKEDMIQAGLMGLYQATIKYDPTVSNNFMSFASIYIISEIKKELRENKLIVMNKEMIRIIKGMKNLEDTCSLEEMAVKLNTTKENILLALDYKMSPISLNTTKDDLELINLVEAPQEKTNYWIVEALEKLDENKKKVINYKYFLGYTQSEISKRFNKSQSFVSRLEKKALQDLRTFIKS